MLFAAAGSATGEESDFDKLLKRNAEMVYKLAFARCGNEADADDIFQQVFLRYLTRKPNFASDEHEKPGLFAPPSTAAKAYGILPFADTRSPWRKRPWRTQPTPLRLTKAGLIWLPPWPSCRPIIAR